MTTARKKRDHTWTAPDGSTITESQATQLADDFEADDSALDAIAVEFPRRAGRPSLDGAPGRSPQVTFRLPKEEREQAERLAQARGTTVSALARQALEDLLRQAG